MAQTKRKNHAPKRPSRSAFIALWAASYAAFCIALWGLLGISPAAALNWPMCTVGTVGIIVLISTVQARLGQRFFKHPMQGWIDSGSIGIMLTIVLLAAMSPTTPVSAVTILTLPMVFVQTGWLWRRSRGAWLWPLANLLVLLPALQYSQWHANGLLALLIPLVGLAEGTLQGLLISQMWAALPSPDKRKRFLVSDESEEDAAIQRLRLNEATEEIIDAAPLVQHQADLS